MTMAVPRIHYHSDYRYFAGCEKMLEYFFADRDLREAFSLTFSYKTSPRYDRDLETRIHVPLPVFPLDVWDVDYRLERISSSPLRLGARAANILFQGKYLALAWNVGVLYRFFRREMRREPIRILHVNNGGYPGANSCLAAVLAGHLARIPNILMTVNNLAVPYVRIQRVMDYPLDRWIARRVDRFITGSAHARGQLEKVLALGPGKAVNIANGISRVIPTETREQVRARLGIPDEEMTLAVGAALEERKGHRYLLQALAAIKTRTGRIPLTLLAGEGPERSALEHESAELGLGERVRFLGQIADVNNLLNAVDIVALPSIFNEDFPFIILEAMCLGKPIVASRMAGIPEQIESGRNGLLVEPRDVPGLADAIGRMVADNAFRVQMGMAAAERFERDFIDHVAVRRYCDLYRSMAG